MIRFRYFFIFLCFFISGAAVADSKFTDNVEFSGFARLVAGHLDENNGAAYIGYDNGISVDEQSLLGLQMDVKLSDSLSLTSQLLAHSATYRKSGIEWLYLKYSASPKLAFRIGKQRTPFFNYSDVLDVGFAYPWVTPPEGIYNSYQVSSYDGANVRYVSSVDDLVYSFEGYWGSNDNELNIAGIIEGVSIQPEVNDLRGVIVGLRMNQWSARASINALRVNAFIPELQLITDTLNAAGFPNSANSLEVKGDADFYHASLKYEDLDWLFEAEYTGIRSDVTTIPSIDGTALTVAYNFYPYTVFASASFFDASYGQPESEIPQGVSPLLDQLSAIYNDVFVGLPFDDSNIYAVGIRMDLSPSVAIKFSTSFIDGEENKRSFFTSVPDGFDRKAVLYQASLEWFF